jgi:hypothetical protein
MSLTAKKTRTSLGNPADIDNEGLLVDVDVQPIHEDVQTREDKRRDIDHFFNPPVSKTVNGNMKKYCSCKLCPYASHLTFLFTDANCSCSDKKSLVNEATTLRRHLEAHHLVSLLLIPCLLSSFLAGKIPQMGSKCQV